MSTTTEWTPTSEAEQKLKDAFAALESSNDKVVIPETVETPKRFVMHTRGYYGMVLGAVSRFSGSKC